MEKIQGRATIFFYGFSEQAYKERIRCLNLAALKDIRIRLDIVEMYKIV